MEIYANRLCISHTELVNVGISKPNIDAMVRRDKLEQVRRGCNGTPALFSVESLPMKYRCEVYKRYPDAKEQADSKPFVDTVEPDGAALQYFADYVLSDGRHLTNDKQQEYANNCAILNAFALCIDRANSHRIRQSKAKIKMGEFWTKAAAALPRLSDSYPNSLPQNARRLHIKYNEYRKDGYVAMISKKFQNSNAAKVDDEQKESVLTQLIAHHNNLDNVMIAEYYNAVSEAQGWEKITASSVGVWREKLDLITATGRRGLTNFRNEKTMQVKRRRPTAPWLMWSLDGWDVELYYQKVEENKKGHKLLTYTHRLTVEVVLDPCCNYPIGYAIGYKENAALIREALRDAARHSKELTGQMLKSNQMQYDHFLIKSMTHIYQIIGEKMTPARVQNAKAKPVESYFGYLNKQYCKRCNNWSGFGITTDPKKQPNSDALNKIRRTFPDESEVMAQIHEIMARERAKKHDQFMEMYANLPEERRIPLTKENYLLNFGDTTGNTNAMEGSGLRPTLLGMKMDYDSFDLSFREHAGEKWTVMYDPQDLDEVLAVNADGSLRYMLEKKYVQPMALADRKDGDAEQLSRVMNFNKKLESHVITKMIESHEVTEKLIEQNPRLGNILNRSLLTDSRGQHKLPKAKIRLEPEDVDFTEIQMANKDKDDFSIF